MLKREKSRSKFRGRVRELEAVLECSKPGAGYLLLI
jgi:hypothetical protein